MALGAIVSFPHQSNLFLPCWINISQIAAASIKAKQNLRGQRADPYEPSLCRNLSGASSLGLPARQPSSARLRCESDAPVPTKLSVYTLFHYGLRDDRNTLSTYAHLCALVPD